MTAVKMAKLNRQRSKENKLGSFWCDSCDANLVHPGQKCSNCGNVAIPSRRKDRAQPLKEVIDEIECAPGACIIWR